MLNIEQVKTYLKAVDSGRIETRPLDGMQGLARLALSEHERAEKAEAENERLRTALGWYADPSVYEKEPFEGMGMAYPVMVDLGILARAALSTVESQP